MSKRIKGITVEIGGDTSKLSDSLKKVNTDIKKTQSQLKDVNKLLKLDPGNTELISQKHKILGRTFEETKTKLVALKEAQKQAEQALAEGKISQEQYYALKREIIETEQALKSLERQGATTNQTLQNIAVTGEKWQATGRNIESVGKKVLPASLAVAGFGAAAVKTAADFDSGMAKVKAVSGATGAEFDELRDKAREMGAKTKFSASDAAEAMNYMAMAGWKTKDMIEGIEGVMNLAAASGEDLATTSDIVTDALTAFGLKAEDSSHFADVLAAASSNANTNVSMMGETFKYAAPIAGALGYSVEDTALAIGLMANAGIKGSQAGTSLRKIMTELNGEIHLTGQNLGNVEIQTTNTDGSMRSLNDILMDCRLAFSQMTESEKAANAETLVGKQAMSAFLAIMNAAPEDIDKLSNAINNADGTAKKMADTMQDNLAGRIQELKSALQELAISFGELLMPAVLKIVEGLKGFINILNALPTPIKGIIAAIGVFIAALGPVLIVVGKLVWSIGTIMTKGPLIIGGITKIATFVTGTIIPAIGAVVTAIGWIPLAIAAVVAGIVLLWNKCDWFREGLISLWEGIKESAISIWNGLKEFFISLWESIVTGTKAAWEGLSTFFSSLWEGIKFVFTTVIEVIKTVVETVFNGIKTVIETVMNVIKTIIETVWNFISTTTTTVFEGVSSFIKTVWNTIQTTITTVLNAIQTIISTVWNAISTSITTIVQAIASFLTTAWNGIQTTISTVLNAISSIISSIWNGIKSTVTSIMGGIKNVLSSAWNSAKNTVSTVVGNMKNSISTAFSNMQSKISTTMSSINSTIRTGFNNAVNHIKNLASQAYTWGADMIEGIARGIRNTIGKVTSAVKSVASKIRSFLHFSVPDEGPLTDYEEWMPDFMEGLSKGIEKSRHLVRHSISRVAQDMVISPTIPAMERQNNVQSNFLDKIQSAILQNAPTKDSVGDIVIPVYVGGTLLDEVIVDAQARRNIRSGGRF